MGRSLKRQQREPECHRAGRPAALSWRRSPAVETIERVDLRAGCDSKPRALLFGTAGRDKGAERKSMPEMKPWSRPWIMHRIKVALLILIVFIMPVVLFAISEG